VIPVWYCPRFRQPEPALLEPLVAPVPHRRRQVQEPVPVAQAADPVLTPAIRTRMSLVERQVAPGIAIRGVVLPDRAPLTTRLVRAPQPPWSIQWKVRDPGTLGPTVGVGGRTTIAFVGGMACSLIGVT